MHICADWSEFSLLTRTKISLGGLCSFKLDHKNLGGGGGGGGVSLRFYFPVNSSTAMVMSRWSVHLTSLIPGQP